MQELDPVSAKFVGGLLQEDLRGFVAFAASFQIVKEWVPANEWYAGGWIIRAVSATYDWRADYNPEEDRWETVLGNGTYCFPRLADCLAEMYKGL